MPAAKDSISHRGASTVRTAHRYAPICTLFSIVNDAAAARHASPPSLSQFHSQSLSYVPPPPSEASVGSSPLSSASTLTTSSFTDSPESVVELCTRRRLYRPVGNKIDGESLKEPTLSSGLAWTPTLGIQDQSPSPRTQTSLHTLTISPTPSLSSSACLSSGSSQNLPTPQSTFVSNNPFSPANHGHRKHGLTKNMHHPAVQGDEDAFNMRVVTGNIAV
ncbi:hypothetical protein SISNIDRAFT_488732 [Sistotremastrum niveocremeum HHB9708]|uniref:Uncharacterized protein n=1 Tax=Sistotremastrum niveocremeum HHB9708 TaxID=1314777 RepID=A0A164R313_9AGAM|nr:hypothetical protein SISNIDRAFT_488732 [Sistotremastrum niveocremeum HHB9708]